MIDEFKKSIQSNLYEKTRSPLYGTLIISWVIWNWKAIYYVFVVDSSENFFTRLDCINDLTSYWTLYLGPIISSVVFLVAFEWAANYSFWLSVFYKTWRSNKKHITEGKRLITYEQSLKLRNDIRKNEEEFEKLLQERDTEIKEMKDYIRQIESEMQKSNLDVPKFKLDEDDNAHGGKDDDLNSIIEKAKANKIFSEKMRDLYRITQQDVHYQRAGINDELVDFAILNNLIVRSPQMSYGFFKLTEKGKEFMRKFLMN